MSGIEAGDVLAAADALQAGQQVFNADQVAMLLSLAYDSGRTAAYREDLAEMHSVWEDRAERRATYEELVAGRLAEMAAYGRARAAAEGRPYRPHPGGPVDWETGEPVPHLQVVA